MIEMQAWVLSVMLAITTPLKAPGAAPCAIVIDTIWPMLGDSLPDLDTNLRVILPGDTAQYFRTSAIVGFAATTSRAERLRFLRESCIAVIGETPSGNLFVRFADPGPTAAAFRRRLDGIRADARIKLATPILFSTADVRLFGS